MTMHGDPWTPEEEGRLTEAFRAGADLMKLSLAHQRTPGAICGRLAKLNELVVVGSAYYVKTLNRGSPSANSVP